MQIIQRIWLPRALGELAVWYVNFNFKFAQFAAVLGLSGQIGQVDKNNLTVQWLAAAAEAADANKRGLNQFRDETLFGDANDPPPPEPVYALPPPPESFENSIIRALVDLVEKKIQTADAYTEEIGVQLGIVVPKGEAAAPGSIKPSGEYFPALSGYELAAVVTNRGESDMWDCEIRIVGDEKWQVAKTATGKSANVKFDAPEDGKPIQIQARIQLYKKNEKYGQPSDAVYVTLNP